MTTIQYFQLCLTSYYSIISKEIIRNLRVWQQNFLPPIITQSLYFIVFGAFVGSRISGTFNGLTYMQFLVPGLVMMAVIMNSFQNVVFALFGAKFQKSIEEILVSPTPNWIILLGFVSTGVLRGLVIGAIVGIVSLFFVPLQIFSLGYVFLFSLLTATTFSLAGFLNGLFAKSFDDVSIIPTFVLTPLTYLGGVFYSIAQLPPVWQSISRFNPIVYMIDGFRYGFYGVSETSLGLSVGILVSLNIVFGLASWHFLNKGYGLRA